MSEPSDCRDPTESEPPAAAAASQIVTEPPASSPSLMASPEQQPAVEATGEAVVQVETAEAVVQEEVAEAVMQEEPAEVVMQEELAETVVQEEAVHVGDGSGQQAEVELAEDMLDLVDELSLDEELMEMLPTVVEEPENEAKEQKALLEESAEQEVEGGEQVQLVDDENEPEQVQSVEVGNSNVEDVEQPKNVTNPDNVINTQEDVARTESDQHEEGLQQTGEVGEVAVTASEVPDPTTTTTPDHCAGNAEEDADQVRGTEPIAPPEAIQEPADHAETTDEPADPAKTIEQPADPEKTSEDETQLQAGSHDGEKQLDASEAPEPSESQETAEMAEGDVQASKPTIEPEEAAKETNEEDTKEKKKRKKSKEERKKKKSVEKKEDQQEEKSSKAPLLHVRGGFSCGWVGPMLQLLGTMKKLDEFKECHGKRYTPKSHEQGEETDIPNAESEPQQEEEPAQTLDIPEAVIRAPPGEGCPRCGGAVFEAERMKSRFRSYHKPCFNCKACHRILDSTLACDAPDKDVYCKLCYAKKYGPKGYGFGGGKSFLQSDIVTARASQSKPEWVKLDRTTIKPTEGDSGCPRCGGAVFAAELMMSKGQDWHITCFNCRDCKRPLDSTIACDGPDKEIYCKLDYGKRFGPKGFGFGHAPTLVSFVNAEDQSRNETSSQVAAPSMGSKAAPGEGCPRCGFAVFAAETMLHNGRAFHRHCFNCGECSRSLDSTNTCSGPEHEVLCRTCYGKLYGPQGVGYGQGAGVLSMG